MRVDIMRRSVRGLIKFEYTHASGPGGQNVNKVATKVRARLPLDAVQGVSEAEKARATQQLAARIDADGCLFTVSDTERSRARNQELAVQRLIALLEAAARIPRRRIATQASKASIERRLTAKRRRGSIKQFRKIEDE